MPAGRPSLYSEALADEICGLIATSTRGLDSIAKEVGISADSIYSWMRTQLGFVDKYARARKDQTQLLADQIVELADKDRICEKITIKADGSREVVILDQVERTKLQIDSRKWLLSKLDPKKYGERVVNEHTGEDGKAIVFKVERIGDK
jgi:hypothetical protein